MSLQYFCFRHNRNNMSTGGRCFECITEISNIGIKATQPIEPKPILQQGWECGKCGSVYSPSTSKCTVCGPSEYSAWKITYGPTCGAI